MRCPLCRTKLPRDFDIRSQAAVDHSLERLLEIRYPSSWARRGAEAVEQAVLRNAKASRLLVLRFGNRHSLVENPRRSKNGRHLNNHRWSLFLEVLSAGSGSAGSEDQAPASPGGVLLANALIQKVKFGITPYYTAWPKSDVRSRRALDGNPEVFEAPFEITRVGWGYFDTTLRIVWRPELGLPPLELQHELSFDGNGANSLWETELPEGVTVQELLQGVRGTRTFNTPRPPRRPGVQIAVGGGTAGGSTTTGRASNSNRQTERSLTSQRREREQSSEPRSVLFRSTAASRARQAALAAGASAANTTQQ